MYPLSYYAPTEPPKMISVLVDGPTAPVLTLDEAKLRAGFEWTSPDARDADMESYVATATNRVELDTEYALITQTRDVFVYSASLPTVICLPVLSRPLQSVTSISYVDATGASATVDPATYAVDLASASIQTLSSWPTNADPFGKWTVRIVAGWAAADALPPLLVQAVGILTAHLATYGRDLVTADPFAEMPYGYEECVAQYRRVRAA